MVLFRGSLFRAMVDYEIVGERPQQVTPLGDLKSTIHQWTDAHPNATLNDMVSFALSITSSLTFTSTQKGSTPEQIYEGGAAHCVGYALLFNAVMTETIAALQLQEQYQCRHEVGVIYLFGINLNEAIDHPFFRDHDFNSIKDLKTEEVLYIDASLYDYTWIDRVN